MTLTRREAVIAGAAAIVLPAAVARDPRARFVTALRTLETGIGGDARIGVCVIDPITGTSAAWRATERFPMCSTFKLLLVGQVLQRIDRGTDRFDRLIRIPDKTFPNSPVTEEHAGAPLPVRELCRAAMERSDNSAANLLLESIGGPAALTRFLRTTGDPVTRLDRFETDLNEGTPGDPRDTTTPAAMLGTMRRLTVGKVLAPASRAQLISWMANTVTGIEKLRKGLPAGWTVADRTGAGGHNSNNHIALIWPTARKPTQPLFVTSYVTGGPGDDALSRNPIHARIGTLVAELIGGA